ncbi:MAG: M23 family metallopeptidase [Turicibacter sp.]|nr:M23 family metallopeptidase [Turicibacter sp.]MBQ1785197.1 M23 family metallopeptidase [Turicibacter sp.]MEE0880948.1 M23 family metallopeptidase [Turicibacter sp.]MEE1237332.1 M23 family metallopeptidase [Turicibacter sp.]
MKFKERMTNLKGKKLFKKIDPISLALVVLLGASATFAGVQLWLTGMNGDQTVSNPSNSDNDIVYVNEDGTTTVNKTTDPETLALLEEVIKSPLEGEEVTVAKSYYDQTADTTTQVNSLFYYKVGETMYSHESKGVSLKDTNNETVNVVAALSGKVASVKDEILKGTVVTIEHENGVETVYTGVYNVNVEAGDEVEQGTVLGKTGLSQLEPDSGNVIHFEVLKDDVKVNPETVIDKKLGDL